MLDTLDLLIGFTVVMLVVSMAVTMVTQAFSTALVNLRGRCLHAGIAKLLALMDRGLTPAEARQLADHILRNPLVGKAPLFGKRHGLTSVIHREELTKLILDFAIEGDADKADESKSETGEAALRRKVRASLASNGIEDPAAVLTAVRTALVDLEKTNPELSHNARLNIALLNFAASDYLAKLNSWFDQSIDRVSELFTRRIRIVTVLVAIAMAFLLQLDAVGLINRLSVDDELRTRLVSQAVLNEEAWGDQVTPAPGVAATPTPAPTPGAEAPAVPPVDHDALRAELRKARASIEELGVVTIPRDLPEWNAAWWEPNGTDQRFRWPFLFGILLSAALLSLGAPWWYSVLANLLKLRSLIARKDEAQREERQTTQAAPASGGGTSVQPVLAGGEAGDLTATG